MHSRIPPVFGIFCRMRPTMEVRPVSIMVRNQARRSSSVSRPRRNEVSNLTALRATASAARPGSGAAMTAARSRPSDQPPASARSAAARSGSASRSAAEPASALRAILSSRGPRSSERSRAAARSIVCSASASTSSTSSAASDQAPGASPSTSPIAGSTAAKTVSASALIFLPDFVNSTGRPLARSRRSTRRRISASSTLTSWRSTSRSGAGSPLRRRGLGPSGGGA